MSATPVDPAKFLSMSVCTDGELLAAIAVAKEHVKKHTEDDIDIEVRGDLPDNVVDWITKTGCNSLITEGSWDFLEDRADNKRFIELWDKCNIKKIIMSYNPSPDKYVDHWICDVHYKEGYDYFVIEWFPRALRWASSSTWGGYSYCYWYLEDEIVFGLQLYRLAGKCFYKSDWLDEFEDVDPASLFPNGTKKYRRWFQFRHWTLVWYQGAESGWNKPHTKKPPKLPDGSDFRLDAILDFPSMPDVKLPTIKLPSLPDIEMPSMPSMPSISAPSISAPSLPSLSAPSLGSLPSMPPRKKRPENPWAVNGIIEIDGLHAVDSGKKIIFSDATVWQFWEKDGYIEDEKEEHKRFELVCFDEEQAKSWADSLEEVGCKRDQVGGCCTIA